MRLLGSIALPSLLLTSTAFADPEAARVSMPPPAHAAPAPAPAAAAVDRRLPRDVGQLREARMAAPDPVAVTTAAPAAREHAVAPPPVVAAAAADDADVTAELAARQMRRQERAFAGCKAAALKRAPAASGAVLLAIDIAERKVQSAHVTEDDVHDPAFAACVTSTAQKLAFSLGAARFAWKITIR
jgi:hypothetical protein